MKINGLSLSFNILSRIGFMALFALFLTACVTESDRYVSESSKDIQGRADNHSKLAANYIKLEQYETAENELEKALSSIPDHSHANYVKALLFLRLERSTEAERYFKIAINSDSQNSAAAHDYGVYLCRTKRAVESMQYFDSAIANPLFSDKSLSYLRAGECIAPSDRLRARNYLLGAIKENPYLSIALYRMAEILYLDKEHFQARAYIERYTATEGKSPQSLLLAYRIETQAKSTTVAEQYRKELLEKYPGSKEASTLRKLTGLRG